MKPHLTILLLFISLNFLGQGSLDCSSVKTGKFILYDDTVGPTVIKRSKKYQVEKNKTLGVKVKYVIVWLSECTYELREIKSYKGPPEYRGSDTDVLTTEILWIKEGKMKVGTSSNFSDMELEVEIEILN